MGSVSNFNYNPLAGLGASSGGADSSTSSPTAGVGGGSGGGATNPGVGGTSQSTTVPGVQTNSGTGAGTATSMQGSLTGPSTSTGSGEGLGTSMTGTINNSAAPTPTANAGPAIYGTHGNQTLADWQTEQANTFNANQLAAQGQYNTALGQMPYNTNVTAPNPYTQYVNNPATPGQASAAFNTPDNAAAWQNSGLASQVAPSALAQQGGGFAQSQPNNPQYGQNQLNFLLNTLQMYGQGGQNRFGNSYSPIFTGQGTQGNLNGLGNSSANPGGTQSGNNSTSNNFDLSTLLPILLGLANHSSQAGSYGNLGGGAPNSNIFGAQPIY